MQNFSLAQMSLAMAVIYSSLYVIHLAGMAVNAWEEMTASQQDRFPRLWHNVRRVIGGFCQAMTGLLAVVGGFILTAIIMISMGVPAWSDTGAGLFCFFWVLPGLALMGIPMAALDKAMPSLQDCLPRSAGFSESG